MTQTSKSDTIRWIIALVLASISAFGLYSSGFDQKVVWFGLLTVMALVIWAMELLPDALVAIVLPILYIVAEVGPAPRILSPWTGSVGWLVLGGLIIGAFMMKTGLARRSALYCINMIGGSFVRLLWGILLAGIILAPFIPSVLGRSAVLAVICLGICESLNLRHGSREGFCVIFAGFLAVSAPKLAFVTGGADLAVGMRLTAEAMGTEMVSWIEYFIHNFLPAMLYSIISMICLLVVVRPKMEGNIRALVQEQLDSLGKVTVSEKKALLILCTLLLFMVTDKLHGVNIGWIMLLLSAVAFLPGFKILDNDDLKKLNYPSVLFVIGCMTIGSAAVACGLDKHISQAILPLMEGTELYSVVAVYVVGIALNFLLTPLSAYSALTTSVVEIAQQLSIEPLLLIYSYNYGLDQYLFPYEYAILLYFYATGYLKIKSVIMILALRMIFTLPFVAFIAYPYWKLFI